MKDKKTRISAKDALKHNWIKKNSGKVKVSKRKLVKVFSNL